MRRLIAPAIAVLLVAAPVAASEREVDYIEGVISDAATAHYTDDDAVAYAQAKQTLIETTEDADASEACRVYADVAVTMFDIVDLLEARPDSHAVKWLGNALASVSPRIRNDCLLAI